jgi:hypothetical protein
MGAVAGIIGAASTVSSGVSQWYQGDALKARGRYEQQIAEHNAHIADMQAEDAIARGYEAEFTRRTQTNQLLGSQRVALAAQGIDIGSGSAADAQYDTQVIGELDATTIRNNARREAWGFRVDAADWRQRGKAARIEGEIGQMNARIGAGSTLLTGAADLYSSQRSLQRTTPLTREQKATRVKAVSSFRWSF